MVSSTPRPHFTPGKDPVPILQAGWGPGTVWTGGKSLPHRDSIPDRSALIQSLYRLSYRAHLIYLLQPLKTFAMLYFNVLPPTYVVNLSQERWDKEIYEWRLKDLKRQNQNKLQVYKQQNILTEWILNVQ